ncbi:MAG: methionyl-tRNA formyltransferase [Elusimicrobia bacterium]|nr:methionyl-tRNA formyltransferase [Elusimicrobiota bacterium]
MKVVFYGTPAVAVPFLEDLARGHEVVGVVTQPDKPAGRGLKLDAPAVKQTAERLGLAVFQPETSADVAGYLQGLSADLAVAVAYGKLLKKDALELPRMGTLNVHFSLLPRCRGAAPVQWSLARGETRTGVTVFWLDEGLDTGPIAASRALDIGPDEDAAQLFERLVRLGRDLLAETVAEAAAGTARREPQSGEPSFAPVIKRDDVRISFGLTASRIHNLVRGMMLGPKAFLDLRLTGRSVRLAVCRTARDAPDAAACPASAQAPGERRTSAPGAIVAVERGTGFLVQCSQGSRLWILSVQPEGKRQMPAVDFLNGARLKVGSVLETS